MKGFLLPLFTFITFLTFSQENNEILIPEHRYQVDESLTLIVCSLDIANIENSFSAGDTYLVLGNDRYTFLSTPEGLNYTSSYEVIRDGKTYDLYFSQAALISIASGQTIVDDPKIPASFTYADLSGVQTSFVGIELRGASSQSYPKKTYDLEFWEDASGEDSRDLQFGNLRDDDDWILDALYNEPLRMRSPIAHQLWLDIHQPYYLDEEEDAKAGAGVLYAEVFLNNSYAGIYSLSEQVDRKLLRIKKFKDGEMRGELYKSFKWQSGNSTFRKLPNYSNTRNSWGDYEWKYPDTEDVVDWKNLYDFTEFVQNSEDGIFQATIGDLVSLENAMDYFIFLNLTRATDNTGKNIYTGKYTSGSPYFFVPWDLDGVFGTDFRGNSVNVTDDVLTNGLFDRLFLSENENNFVFSLRQRWYELRNTILSDDALSERFNASYTFLKDNRLYERESKVWRKYSYDDSSKEYTDNWLQNRLSFLDEYFQINVLNTLDFIENDSKLSVYPNPASEWINLQLASTQKKHSYQIYTMQGALVESGALQYPNTKLDISKLSYGLYLLRVDNFKIVKFSKK